MDSYDVVVVGGGPGGYVAAIRAAQLGLRAAVVEREELGGVCLNWGCIPTKALIHNASLVRTVKQGKEFGLSFEGLHYDYGAAVERSRRVSARLVKGVQALMKKNRIDVFRGEAFLSARDRVQVRPDGPELTAKHVILATGGRSRALPGIPFKDPEILSSREAVVLKELPQSLLIIGGGAIGCEFGYVYRAYDVAVTIVEMLPRLLPLEDPEVSAVVEKQFSKQGIQVRTGTKVLSMEVADGGVRARLSGPTGEEEIRADRALVAIGVQGNVENLGLESLGVQTERGFIVVDEQMRTNVPGVFAIGDVTGKVLLAHVASAQGELAAEVIAGHTPRPLHYDDMPRAVYCQPQVASLGLTEEKARERGYDVRTGVFPFRANGKALGQHDWEGFCKVVIDAKYGEVLGAHLVGPEVTELLPAIGLARTLEGTAEDIAGTVHAHPTLSEAIREAVLVALGRAINF
ncbi:MAG: dihydrolipoyl dehydrogenase [Armatimonadota bacterium]|nr:dihydrolipoyl dehydrogenase [Armatimonadota bacterium]